MVRYVAGRDIHDFRKKMRVTQKKLAYGICSISTLSRIESGEQMPARKLAEALLTRLGQPPELYDLPLTRDEYLRNILEAKMSRSLSLGTGELTDLLKAYREIPTEPDLLEKQHYLCLKTIDDALHGLPPDKAFASFLETIRISIPGFELTYDLDTYLFSRVEQLCINNMAFSLHDMGNIGETIRCTEFLKAYYERTPMNEYEKGNSLLRTLSTLSDCAGISGDIARALALAEEGIPNCVRYSNLLFFYLNFYNKGFSLASLGRKEEGKEYVSFALDMLRESGSKDLHLYVDDANTLFDNCFTEG